MSGRIYNAEVDEVRGRKKRWTEGVRDLVERSRLSFKESKSRARDRSEWRGIGSPRKSM